MSCEMSSVILTEKCFICAVLYTCFYLAECLHLYFIQNLHKMVATVHNDLIVYKGSNFFRQRLLLATLSGRTIKIDEIRSTHDDPGLREHEVSLIRLLDKVTNGTRVELSETGTSVYYQPGILVGGQVTHSCSTQRGIG